MSSLLSVEQLEANVPAVRNALRALGPAGESFVLALLPTLALLIFMSLLPMICLFLSSFQGHMSAGKRDAAAFRM